MVQRNLSLTIVAVNIKRGEDLLRFVLCIQFDSELARVSWTPG